MRRSSRSSLFRRLGTVVGGYGLGKRPCVSERLGTGRGECEGCSKWLEGRTSCPVTVCHAPFAANSEVTLRTPFLHARQGLIFMLSLASLAAAHVVYLQPVVDNMQMTADALCAGVTNFTTFQDAAGLVFLLDGPAPPADDHSSYAYRAVLQATGLEEVHPEPLAARVQNAALRGLAMQLKSMTFEERNEFWPLCRDMDSEVYEGFGLMHMRSATAENLNRLFPDADLAGLERSCWSFRRSAALMVVQISPAFLLRLPEQVACSGMILSFRVHVGTFTVEDAALFRHRFQHKLPHPYDPEGNYCFNGTLPLQSLWHLRALCPVTCGCASLEGSFVANLPSFGCPQVATTIFESLSVSSTSTTRVLKTLV